MLNVRIAHLSDILGSKPGTSLAGPRDSHREGSRGALEANSMLDAGFTIRAPEPAALPSRFLPGGRAPWPRARQDGRGRSGAGGDLESPVSRLLPVDLDLSALPREELLDRARALRTVLQVAEAVGTAGSPEELATRFVDAVVEYTRFPSVVLFRYEPGDETFHALASRGFDISLFGSVSSHLPMKGTLTGLAATRREVFAIEDVASDDRIEPETRRSLIAQGYQGGASIPVVHAGEILGAFNLVYPRGNEMRPAERLLVAALARTLGVAMSRALAVEAGARLEQQAQRAQKLESLGVLAGGIAHDFNNLLVGILGNVDLARSLAAEGGRKDEVELLDETLRAADRARALVRQLLTFSRGGAPVRARVFDLASQLREAALFAVRGTSVLCEVDVVEDPGPAEVDAGQLAQVIQNLVLNAAQSSPSGSRVRVRIGARVLASPEPPLPAGRCARIEVIDEGCGIAAEHIGRIFEPFFTLRPGGTGLGLAVSHSIVHRHGGTLGVRSELGRGTTFTIDLPLGAPPSTAPPPEAAGARATFGGLALVMDDEPAVRSVARRMLERLGFRVLTASDGDEALTIAARTDEPLRLAILDRTVVGGRGGQEIAAELRRLAPGVRLVTCSGYSRDEAMSAPAQSGWDAALEKPFTADRLASAVSEALAPR